MRIKFSQNIDEKIKKIRAYILPKTLFFRTMLLIFVPLIVVQIVSVIAYLNGSWSKISRRLSNNLTANIALVVDLAEEKRLPFEEVQKIATHFYELEVDFSKNDEKYKVLNDAKDNKMVTGPLEEALKKQFHKASINIYLVEKELNILIDDEKGLYRFKTSTKNIFNSSLFGFIAWMIGTSLLLFGVSVLFLRVQARSIRQLANAAESFGKGIDVTFKPYGSSEVRTAGVAFNKMRERIKRQISERTQMLAGVSHDLRTPLTRMKLRLAMMPQNEESTAFLEDVSEMQQMLEGYLAFARGEGTEENTFIDMNALIEVLVNKFKVTNPNIRYAKNNVSPFQGRAQALNRALSNVISNACRYAKNIEISLKEKNNRLEIDIDDDGPGIPEDKREDVFKAFYRLEASRNKQTGGIGLGLSITKDIIRAHGGTIKLSASHMGGLKVEIRIPM